MENHLLWPDAEACPLPVFSLHPHSDLEAQGGLFLTAFPQIRKWSL